MIIKYFELKKFLFSQILKIIPVILKSDENWIRLPYCSAPNEYPSAIKISPIPDWMLVNHSARNT